LQLRDRFQIFGPASGPLELDKPLQSDAFAAKSEGLDLYRVRGQLFIIASTNDLAQQVQVSQPGIQR